MKMFATVATLAAAATLGAPPSASAQNFGGTLFNVSDVGAPYGTPYGALPPYEVITIIRSMGFDPQSRPVLRGRVYIIHAIDNHDIPVRVAVDASSGRVVRVVERMPGAGYGPLPPDRYGAYPVPPAGVPGNQLDETLDEPAPDYRAPDYRAPGNNAYPRPIYPPSSSQSVAPQPRVATRTPPAAPTPRARPPAAPASQDAKTPQGSTTQSSAPATTSSIGDSGRPGISVPAPVASRKVATPPQDTATAKPDTSAKPADTTLVPVAPLE